MIDIVALGNTDGTNIVTKSGIIVGWTLVSITSSLPNPTVYHVLVKPDHYLNTDEYQSPVIKAIWEGRCGTYKFYLIMFNNKLYNKNDNPVLIYFPKM